MVLCDSEIRVALAHGDLVIDPAPPPEHISTSAVDLTLDNTFLRWDISSSAGLQHRIDPSDRGFSIPALRAHLEKVPDEQGGGVLIKPREFLLGMTRERVSLPNESRLAARVEGRSSLARLGLCVHLTAPTIHAGWEGPITLEMVNHGPFEILLRPGLAICQLIIEQVFGTPSAAFQSVFQGQTDPSGGQEE